MNQGLKKGNIIYMTACICFDFPEKLRMHAHIFGRQNKNKLKEKQAESSEQLVNRDPTSIYTSFVSVVEKNMPDGCAEFEQIEGQLLLYNFMVYLLQTISWAKNNKMGHC